MQKVPVATVILDHHMVGSLHDNKDGGGVSEMSEWEGWSNCHEG